MIEDLLASCKPNREGVAFILGVIARADQARLS
jgi:hypothetical protein